MITSQVPETVLQVSKPACMMVIMIIILVLRFIILLNSDHHYASLQDDQHHCKSVMLVLAELILSPSISSAMVLSGLPRLQNGKFSKKHSIGNDSVYKSNGNDTEKVRYLTPVLTPPLPTAAFTNSSLTTYSSFFVCLKTYGSLFETEIILCKGLTRCICLKCVC